MDDSCPHASQFLGTSPTRSYGNDFRPTFLGGLYVAHCVADHIGGFAGVGVAGVDSGTALSDGD